MNFYDRGTMNDRTLLITENIMNFFGAYKKKSET